jgi:Amt family ammonium transporter
VGALTCALFVFGSSYAFFKISNRFVPMRTPANTEIVGLDLPEVGILAYPRDVM